MKDLRVRRLLVDHGGRREDVTLIVGQEQLVERLRLR
jgi:hypothetical protein